MITIKTFDNPVEAHILKSRLESEGIHCYLFDENIVTLNPLYNQMTGGIKLNIMESDISKANEILTEIEKTPFTDENDEQIICPNCKSKNLYGGFRSMKGAKAIFSWIAALILMVLPIYYESVYRCKDCDIEFKPDA
jgi:DNA-directed RNA polymerase subunit RPC12/RpoP